MRLQPADEVVGEVRQAQAARVVLVEEEVRLAVPERHVEVAAVPGQVAERLGHERRQQAALLGECVDHVAEEDRAVAARECVGVREVLLELTVRVLVVVGIVAPAELVDVLRDRGQEVVVPSQAAEVVAGLLERVECVRDLDAAVVRLAEEEVLELESDLELVARGAGALELVAEDRARVVRPFLAFHVDITGKAREARLPRHRSEARQVGHRREVGVVGQLPDLTGRKAGESGTVVDEIVEASRRHELRARAGVHVDELREVELDRALLRLPTDIFHSRCCRCHHRLALLRPRMFAP